MKHADTTEEYELWLAESPDDVKLISTLFEWCSGVTLWVSFDGSIDGMKIWKKESDNEQTI